MYCKDCKKNKDINLFATRDKEKYRYGTYRTTCNDCRRLRQNKNYKKYKEVNPFKCRCVKLKATAKVKNVAFNLTPEYLENIWTGFCPISNIKLDWNAKQGDENAPELDRFVPNNGYTVGNVSWISRKMNRLKNNASKEDLEQLLKWLKENKC